MALIKTKLYKHVKQEINYVFFVFYYIYNIVSYVFVFLSWEIPVFKFANNKSNEVGRHLKIYVIKFSFQTHDTS